MRIERMDLLNDGFQRPMKVTHGNVNFVFVLWWQFKSTKQLTQTVVKKLFKLGKTFQHVRDINASLSICFGFMS